MVSPPEGVVRGLLVCLFVFVCFLCVLCFLVIYDSLIKILVTS